MKKIPTIFLRDLRSRPSLVTHEWVAGCEWVREGAGVATRKWDGSACLILQGILYKRLEWDARKGLPPKSWLHHDFLPAVSGHGWLPITEGAEDWMHRLMSAQAAVLPEGTYELCGPKMGKNPEKLSEYTLLRHGVLLLDVSRTFEGIHDYLVTHEMEGIVWHHPDGRMAKIKRRDFGLTW